MLLIKEYFSDMKRTRHSSSRAGRAMIMRIFFTNSLMKFTSSLSDLSVDYTAAKQKRYMISVFYLLRR